MTAPRSVIRIDPTRAISWEPPDTVRIGFDPPIARAVIASPGAELALAQLMAGLPEGDWIACDRSMVDDEGNPTFAIAPDADPPHGARELFLAIRPALVLQAQPLRGPKVASAQPSAIRALLSDDGREVPGLRECLTTRWLCSFERDGAAPEIVVQVLRYLEPLERTRRWLGKQIPHLLVRFTDSGVRVGPVVEPQGSPCHGCEMLHLVDADPYLPSVTAQLIGSRPGSETLAVALAVGATAAQFLESWRAGEAWVRDTQVQIRTVRGRLSGLPKLTRIRPHPECGCAIGVELADPSLRHKA